MKRTGFLILMAILILSSCRNTLEPPEPAATGSGTITVTVARDDARTVVPDFAGQVASVEISLSSNDGYAAPAPANATAATSWAIAFAGVQAGSWNVSAVAEDTGGVRIGLGKRN